MAWFRANSAIVDRNGCILDVSALSKCQHHCTPHCQMIPFSQFGDSGCENIRIKCKAQNNALLENPFLICDMHLN
jgi:hypothetical protein